MAVYDRRAHAGLVKLGLKLDNGPGRYKRYMGLLEECRSEQLGEGVWWTARQVDLALYWLGANEA